MCGGKGCRWEKEGRVREVEAAGGKECAGHHTVPFPRASSFFPLLLALPAPPLALSRCFPQMHLHSKLGDASVPSESQR